MCRPNTKYPDWDSPEDCARVFSYVAEDNYLAHSIREIEKTILRKHSINYHILIFKQGRDIPFKVFFRKNSCEIRIQDIEISSIISVRLRLAHEIGHLIYNIDLLPNSEKIDALNRRGTASLEEELFAWIFAFEMIKEKSGQYHDDMYKDYQFTPSELKKTIAALTSDIPELNAALNKRIRLAEAQA